MCTHVHTHNQELLGLYDEIEHTKEMGIEYSGNTVMKTVAGTSAERQGVRSGWRIAVVPLHTCMLHVCFLLCIGRSMMHSDCVPHRCWVL